jgi:muramoyltetrapeptide carboxypeptidase
VLTAVIGSAYLPDFRGSILFLEDVDENIHRIDRMLTQLRLAGVLQQLAGFVFGDCANCLPFPGPGQGFGGFTLIEVLRDHIQPLGIPAWEGAMIGHMTDQWTLPVGAEVEIDAARGTMRMLEPAVG